MTRKLFCLLCLYIPVYIISFINIYTLYVSYSPSYIVLINLSEIILMSLTTNIFIISISIFVLMLLRDHIVTITLILSYFLIEECLWRCKITQKYGILGHLYEYADYAPGEMIKIKIVYLILSFIFMLLACKLSMRERKNLFFRFKN